MTMKELGVRLQFDGHSQRLKRIRYTPTSVSENRINNTNEVIYDEKKLFSSEMIPNCEFITSVFPPTMLGVFRQSDRTYSMCFKDGVNFEFKIKDSETFNLFKDKKEHPIRLGNYSPCVAAFEILHSSSAPTSSTELPRFEIYPYEGVKLRLPNSSHGSWIRLGSGIQDVVSTLGPPERTGHVFLNFFNFGLDVKIDQDNGCVVRKIVLHANIPGHSNFGRYRRALFDIMTDSNKKNKAKLSSSDEIRINNESRIEDLIEKWSDPGPPVVLSNPSFPQVQYFYHFDCGLNVEVNSNGIIGSIELYSR